VLVNTVDDNKSKYTNRDYSQATLARKIQNIIGRPSTKTFLHIVDNNLMPNCPISRDDIITTEDILGHNLGSLKGKTTRSKNEHVRSKHINIPINIMSRYREVTLAGDIMFVNRIPFFMTVSRHIKFGTAKMIKSQTGSTLLTAIKQVKGTCMKHGFKVTHPPTR
jgi:hypothetical protein